MIVRLLTQEQKDLIYMKMYREDSYFLPIEDDLGRWVITSYEIDNCSTGYKELLINCPEIEFIPKHIVE
jgi:hypothetical protein